MKRNSVFWAAVVAVTMLTDIAGCSRSQTGADSQSVPDYSKLYDPSSLKEVSDFNALPPGLKKHFEPLINSYFVGGLSNTSALVSYQVGDYVPTFAAEAFVYANSQWIKVKTWDGIGQPKNLSELFEVIQTAENSTPPKGLNYTLSSLNLTDPISDLNKNIARDKTYFIGLCEPPGHTPGVAEADEALVHTLAHGLWCLPGSGDPVTNDEYAKLIDQARAYATKYNAELVRRIHSGLVK